jgi:hypothetical protein
MRVVKSAIWTSGEPESFSARLFSVITASLRSFVIVMGYRDSSARRAIEALGQQAPGFSFVLP